MTKPTPTLQEAIEKILKKNRLGYSLSSGLPFFNKDDPVSRNIEVQTAQAILAEFKKLVPEEYPETGVGELAWSDELRENISHILGYCYGEHSCIWSETERKLEAEQKAQYKIVDNEAIDRDHDTLKVNQILSLLQSEIDRHYQDYYLGLLPEKKEPDLPIGYTDSGKINVNSQYTRGFNACRDQMEASIREGSR